MTRQLSEAHHPTIAIPFLGWRGLLPTTSPLLWEGTCTLILCNVARPVEFVCN